MRLWSYSPRNSPPPRFTARAPEEAKRAPSPLCALRAAPNGYLGPWECPLGEAAPRICGIELMKAFNVWRVEEGRVRRASR